MADIRIEAEQMTLVGFSVENSLASSGGKVVNAGSGTGRATTQFDGEAGTYSLEVAYHDENDGESPLSVLVDGVVVDSWTANEATDSTIASRGNLRKRLVTGIDLTASSAIELRGTRNAGEFARFDYLNIISSGSVTPPTPPPSNPSVGSTTGVGRLEAEDMSLVGYTQERSSDSSGGEVVWLTSGSGTAATRFVGSSGNYDLVVAYNDENDGQSPVSVKINGQVVDSWTFNESTDSSTVSTGNLRRRVISGVSLNANSVIEIEGSVNQNEYARLDYLEIAAAGSVPSEPPSGPTVPPNNGSVNINTNLQAEDALISGAKIENSQSGSEGGYVDYQGRSGDFIEWTVNTQSAGNYELAWRYANGSSNRPLKFSVNGSVIDNTLDFDGTGSWRNWRTAKQTVSLAAGTNKIRLQANGSSGANFDHLRVSVASGQPPTDGGPTVPPNNGSANINTNLQAESALISGAKIENERPGSEGGYVDYQGRSGDFIEWTVNTQSAGNYELAWRYANGSSNRPLKFSVNGNVVDNTLDFNGTGSWNNWGTAKQTVSLAAGTNKIRLQANGSSGANFDYLRVSEASGQPPTNGGGSKLRVLPLGDSNTKGDGTPGGYRIQFWERAVNDGVAIDFLGTRNNGPSSLGDGDHQGQGGWSIPQMTSWIRQGNLAAQNPDIILFMMGTNDANTNGNVSGAEIRDRLSTLIDEVSRVVPGAHMFVSSILPLDTPRGTAAEAQSARDFNALIPALVQQKANQGKKVSFVDAGGSLNVGDINGDNSRTNDEDDGLHATAAGYDKLGDAWYDGVNRSSVWRNAVNQLNSRSANLVQADASNSQSANSLTGDGQNNVLQSRAGTDLITGGLGADVIVYDSLNDGVDQILDFTSSDRIRISASDFGGDLSAGMSLGSSDYVLGSNAVDGGSTFLFDESQNLLSFDVDGTGRQSAVGLATFSNGFTPQASQFQIV